MAKKYQAKTVVTKVDVDTFINKIESEQKRDDCRAITKIMADLSGEPATMWGSSMVGFGNKHYEYDSGHSGDTFVVGFAPRKQNIVLYLQGAIDSFPADVKKLGNVKTGVGCIYINKLEDIDTSALKTLIGKSIKLSGSGKKDVSKQSQPKPAKVKKG
jgi:hypothetical protein